MGALTNPKHEKFAQAIASGSSQDDAYVGAGFRSHRANASRLRAKESVSARITELTKKNEEYAELGRDDLLRELENIIGADMRAFYKADGSLKKITELDDRCAAALAGMDVEVLAGTKTAGLSVRKFKRWDKLKAIELYAKITGRLIGEGTTINVASLETLIIASMTKVEVK